MRADRLKMGQEEQVEMSQGAPQMCEERPKMSEERRKLSEHRFSRCKMGQDGAKMGQDAARLGQCFQHLWDFGPKMYTRCSEQSAPSEWSERSELHSRGRDASSSPFPSN